MVSVTCRNIHVGDVRFRQVLCTHHVRVRVLQQTLSGLQPHKNLSLSKSSRKPCKLQRFTGIFGKQLFLDQKIGVSKNVAPNACSIMVHPILILCKNGSGDIWRSVQRTRFEIQGFCDAWGTKRMRLPKARRSRCFCGVTLNSRFILGKRDTTWCSNNFSPLILEYAVTKV